MHVMLLSSISYYISSQGNLQHNYKVFQDGESIPLCLRTILVKVSEYSLSSGA